VVVPPLKNIHVRQKIPTLVAMLQGQINAADHRSKLCSTVMNWVRVVVVSLADQAHHAQFVPVRPSNVVRLVNIP
jgi:hypothetical protein